MADATMPESEAAPKKRGLLLPLLIGLVLAGGAGAGGYWAVTQGPLSSLGGHGGDSGHGGDGEAHETPPAYTPVAFVPLETVMISLGEGEGGRHLIFTAQLEVQPGYADEVAHLAPRVMDVLNSYLRVVEVRELSDPASLNRLRAQMLRRIQIVTGEGRVRDLLITQFVVN